MGLEHDDRLVLGPSNTKLSCKLSPSSDAKLVSFNLLLDGRSLGRMRSLLASGRAR